MVETIKTYNEYLKMYKTLESLDKDKISSRALLYSVKNKQILKDELKSTEDLIISKQEDFFKKGTKNDKDSNVEFTKEDIFKYNTELKDITDTKLEIKLYPIDISSFEKGACSADFYDACFDIITGEPKE